MAMLAKNDIKLLEKYLQMGSGHLLDFSHRTLAEFFGDYSVDIDEPQYQVGSGSKANRMRGFWQESNDLTLGLVLKGLIDYYDEKRSSSTYFDTAQLGSKPSQAPFTHAPTQQTIPVRQIFQQTVQAPVQQPYQAQAQPRSTGKSMNKPQSQTRQQKVFIVHGHDELLRFQVEHFVRTIGLKPIVLMNQASGGNTIIEKIEEYGEADYAIVLYTLCDEGRKIGTSEFKGRARQNVVFEHGYFIARLGRNKVSAMVKAGVEIQNDIQGVVYIGVETDWQTQLMKEFRKAELKFDANALIEN